MGRGSFKSVMKVVIGLEVEMKRLELEVWFRFGDIKLNING